MRRRRQDPPRPVRVHMIDEEARQQDPRAWTLCGRNGANEAGTYVQAEITCDACWTAAPRYLAERRKRDGEGQP